MISISDLEKYQNKNLTEKEKETLILSLIYYSLNEQISREELSKYPEEIIQNVNCIIYGDMLEDNYDKLNKKLSELLVEKALETKNFSLEEFLEKPDRICYFKRKCPYNILSMKSALGLIEKNNAFYCEIPSHIINHANLVTGYYRKQEPEFEDLGLYHFFHKEDSDWHNKILKEKEAIIIHFIPNEYGEVIYIPEELTEFQYSELVRINKLLLSKNIKAETNYKGLNLNEALNDPDFIKDHITQNNEIKSEKVRH